MPNAKPLPRSGGRWLPPSTLPPLYRPWVDELLAGPIPAETEATCHDCAMCAGAPGTQLPGFVSFKPDTKCCTYVPGLRNFLVGLILQDDDSSFADGRATVEARLDARVAVTPAGISPLPVQLALYRLGGVQAFGQNRTLRCPHYLEAAGGQCGIWRYRNGICATWFCKNTRGPVGARFWQALEQLLTTVEHQLARWCIGELDVDPEAVARLVASDMREGPIALDGDQVDGTVTEATYRAVWGGWYGREREFFRRAGDLVRKLTWPEVLAAAGADARLLAGQVLHRYHALTSDQCPDRLTVGRVTAAPAEAGRVLVDAHRGDGLDLPAELWAALPAFDGRRTDEVLRTITARHGISLRPELIRKLVDFELLVPAPEREGGDARR